MGNPSGGVRTRRRQYVSFCEHYSFVSCLEPSNVDEALEDPDWVMAMQEELNNFTRNEVWVLEERPQDKNIIGTKWVFRNKQDLWQRASHKLKGWILVKHLPPLQDLKPSVSF